MVILKEFISTNQMSQAKLLLPLHLPVRSHLLNIPVKKDYNLNTLKPRQNGRHFADDTFKCIFLKENVRIWIKISLKFVPGSPIDNMSALSQIMAWRRPGDKPLSEAMIVSLLTHICVAQSQWVNGTSDARTTHPYGGAHFAEATLLYIASILMKQPLTHWGRYELATMSQTKLSNAFF